MPNSIECTSCGFPNRAANKYCDKCNKRLAVSIFRPFIQKLKGLPAVSRRTETISEFVGKPGDIIESDFRKKYEIIRQIGSGSYGDVFLVIDKNAKNTSDLLAIKVLRMWSITHNDREKARMRFQREYEVAKNASDSGSAYIVHAKDKGFINGNPFFVMQYCSGGSLRDKITNGSLSTREIKNLAIRILNGLGALHTQGIVHRDLKPENILFQDNEAKISDFGISGFLKSRITITDNLGTGRFHAVLGTDIYLPPEQFDIENAHKTLGNVTDIFAFGITMFEVLSNGRLPYGPPPSPEQISMERYNSELENYYRKISSNQWELLDGLRGKHISCFWADMIERCIEADYRKRVAHVEMILEMLGENLDIPEEDFLTGDQLIIRVMNGWEPNKVYNLSELMSEKCFLTLGRHEQGALYANDIDLLEPEEPCYISRRHATIEVMNTTGNWYIRDGQYQQIGSNFHWKESKNGTFLDSQPVYYRGTKLNPGNLITIGDTTIRVERY